MLTMINWMKCRKYRISETTIISVLNIDNGVFIPDESWERFL